MRHWTSTEVEVLPSDLLDTSSSHALLPLEQQVHSSTTRLIRYMVSLERSMSTFGGLQCKDASDEAVYMHACN